MSAAGNKPSRVLAIAPTPTTRLSDAAELCCVTAPRALMCIG